MTIQTTVSVDTVPWYRWTLWWTRILSYATDDDLDAFEYGTVLHKDGYFWPQLGSLGKVKVSPSQFDTACTMARMYRQIERPERNLWKDHSWIK